MLVSVNYVSLKLQTILHDNTIALVEFNEYMAPSLYYLTQVKQSSSTSRAFTNHQHTDFPFPK